MDIHEQEKLMLNAKNGDEESKRVLFEYELKMVIKFAKELAGYGLPLEDTIQEGALALTNAMDRYNPNNPNVLFGKYAYSYVYNHFRDASYLLNRTVGLASDDLRDFIRYNASLYKLAKKLNRKPSDEELMLALSINRERLDYIKKINEEDLRLSDLNYPDYSFEDDVLERLCIDKMLNDAKGMNISERDIEIIKIVTGYYGMDVYLSAIGSIYDISRARVEQIEKITPKKIRKNLFKDSNGQEINPLLKEYALDRLKEDIKNPKYLSLFDYSKGDIKAFMRSINNKRSKLYREVKSAFNKTNCIPTLKFLSDDNTLINVVMPMMKECYKPINYINDKEKLVVGLTINNPCGVDLPLKDLSKAINISESEMKEIIEAYQTRNKDESDRTRFDKRKSLGIGN
jgi:RNA polymerase sigma factor (sigma-70 family)